MPKNITFPCFILKKNLNSCSKYINIFFVVVLLLLFFYSVICLIMVIVAHITPTFAYFPFNVTGISQFLLIFFFFICVFVCYIFLIQRIHSDFTLLLIHLQFEWMFSSVSDPFLLLFYAQLI